jgi:hypothetical protein
MTMVKMLMMIIDGGEHVNDDSGLVKMLVMITTVLKIVMMIASMKKMSMITIAVIKNVDDGYSNQENDNDYTSRWR